MKNLKSGTERLCQALGESHIFSGISHEDLSRFSKIAAERAWTGCDQTKPYGRSERRGRPSR